MQAEIIMAKSLLKFNTKSKLLLRLTGYTSITKPWKPKQQKQVLRVKKSVTDRIMIFLQD